MYYALYRKYRPQNFDSVVGQDVIVKTLRNSIIHQSFSHAYLFFGPRGTGKTTLSKIFARSINCFNPINGNSCGECDACLHSYEKECVDIIEIDAASNNGVDEIRELKNKISFVPTELKYKVYIIDEVHMLSIGAFNALLKTLEEPPKHAIFILATTDLQKVPETIVSRCQCFSFKRISNDMLVERMKFVCKEESIDIDDEVLSEIAISSDGGMRDSLGILDKLSSYTDSKITLDDFAELNGVITKKELNKFCCFLFSSDVSSILSLINDYNNQGKNLIQILSQLMYFLRDMLVDYYVLNSAPAFSVSEISRLINVINENMFDIKRSSNPRIYIEIMFLNFIEDLKKADGDSFKNISREINVSDSDKNKVVQNTDLVISGGSNDVNNVDVAKQVNFDSSVENIVDHDASSSVRKILNIDEVMKVRINNTFAGANKDLLKEEIEKMKLLNDFTFDQQIGYIVCSLLDSKVRVVSKDSMIISYEYDSVVDQNLVNLDKLSSVYHDITHSDKKIAIISDENWESEKRRYIKNLKEGIQYSFQDEPDYVLEDVHNDDIMVSDAVKLFGDIVEID